MVLDDCECMRGPAWTTELGGVDSGLVINKWCRTRSYALATIVISLASTEVASSKRPIPPPIASRSTRAGNRLIVKVLSPRYAPPEQVHPAPHVVSKPRYSLTVEDLFKRFSREMYGHLLADYISSPTSKLIGVNTIPFPCCIVSD